jgi:non-heme chloroperoxidase
MCCFTCSCVQIGQTDQIYYPGRPHGLTATHQDEVNADLLKFVKSVQQTRKAAT